MIASVLFTLLPLVSAIVTPNTPDGSTVVNEGETLNVAWAADDTGSWTNVTIQLMTGDNFQANGPTDQSVKDKFLVRGLSGVALMHPVALATGIDGTSTTTFTTPVPDVEPNSKIYFLQFTNNGETEATWTTRFTIAGADGSTTEPEQSTQTNGDAVPWGIGAVVGDTPAPADGNATLPSASASASEASSSSRSGITNYEPSSTGSPIANPSNGSGPSRSTASTGSASASASDSAASASTSPNGASAIKAGGLLGLVGIVMGLAL